MKPHSWKFWIFVDAQSSGESKKTSKGKFTKKGKHKFAKKAKKEKAEKTFAGKDKEKNGELWLSRLFLPKL